MGMELEVITAVVLGGTSIYGGRGTIAGTVLGVLFIHELREFMGWQWHRDELTLVTIGCVLILAVLAIGLALLIFAALTRGLDEIAELRKGNLAVGGLLAGVVLGVGMMVSQAVSQIMTAVSTILF